MSTILATVIVVNHSEVEQRITYSVLAALNRLDFTMSMLDLCCIFVASLDLCCVYVGSLLRLCCVFVAVNRSWAKEVFRQNGCDFVAATVFEMPDPSNLETAKT